jgi:hypothetical protein
MLAHGTLDDQAGMLSRHFAMNWTGLAFTRCLLDNTLLRPAMEHERASVPPDVRQQGIELRACPACHRVFWQGSHYRRMMARLLRWQEGL